tara:strand:+ start:341 stop:877 length:537 start_codon:yes stop_codon:yes gene_type:complete
MNLNSTYPTVLAHRILCALTVFFVSKFGDPYAVKSTVSNLKILSKKFDQYLKLLSFIFSNLRRPQTPIYIIPGASKQNQNFTLTGFYISASISTLYKIFIITINGVYQMKKENNNNGYQEFDCEHTGDSYIIDNQDYSNKSLSIADISDMWTKCYGEIIEEKESGFIKELVKLVKEVK